MDTKTLSLCFLHISFCDILFFSYKLLPLLPPLFSSRVNISVCCSIYECLQRGGRAAGVTTFPDGLSELIPSSLSLLTCFVTSSDFSLKSRFLDSAPKLKAYNWWCEGEIKVLSADPKMTLSYVRYSDVLFTQRERKQAIKEPE